MINVRDPEILDSLCIPESDVLPPISKRMRVNGQTQQRRISKYGQSQRSRLVGLGGTFESHMEDPYTFIDMDSNTTICSRNSDRAPDRARPGSSESDFESAVGPQFSERSTSLQSSQTKPDDADLNTSIKLLFDQNKTMMAMLTQLTKQTTAQDIDTRNFRQESTSRQDKFEERLIELERKLSEKPCIVQHSPIGVKINSNKVPQEIYKHVADLYESSPLLTFRPEEPFRSQYNSAVKKALLEELMVKFDKQVRECTVAVHNRYKNARWKHLVAEKGNTESELRKKKTTSLKHRKLKARRNVMKSEEEMEYGDGIGADLMSDEEETESVNIINIVKMPFRSEKLEKFIKEADKRRTKGKVVGKIRVHVNRGIEKTSLLREYSSDYVN